MKIKAIKEKVKTLFGKITGKKRVIMFIGIAAIILAAVIIVLFATHVFCTHKWSAATCTEPQICSICQRTKGEPMGHKWKEATCTEPEICEICGAEQDKALGHDWKEATCTEPKTCVVCGETTGNPLGHKWQDANCLRPKICSVCGKTEGEKGEHSWEKATCRNPKTCSTCGKTSGKKLGHDWEDATCQKPKTCKRCGQTTGGTSEHNWVDATFSKPKTCTVCGKTEGEKRSAYGLTALDYAEMSLDDFLTVHPDAVYEVNVEGGGPGYYSQSAHIMMYEDGIVAAYAGNITNDIAIGMSYNDIINAVGKPDEVGLNEWSMSEYMVYYIDGYRLVLGTFKGSCKVNDSRWILEQASIKPIE